MTVKIFIDGNEGTTGLQLSTLLNQRNDISLISIDPALRKEPVERQYRMNSADVVFLCLPDDASKDAMNLISSPDTCVIDTSSAFRVHTDWVYGLPELENEQRSRIQNSKRISNPGCHATAFILSIRPLVDAGLLPKNYPISAFSFTGYSGGGKTMIDSYEALGANPPPTPQPYALNLEHKHLPEIVFYAGLTKTPVFIPSIGSFYQGLSVWIPIIVEGVSPQSIYEAYQDRYKTERFIRVHEPNSHDLKPDYFFDVEGSNHTNRVDIFIMGNSVRQCIVARIDNLGKGAAGSAIQNLNIYIGAPENYGLKD